MTLNDRQIRKNKYTDFCQNTAELPVFLQYWWLDAVAGDSWDVALVEKGGQIVGVLPYVIQKSLGFTFLKMAKLTPFLGPWIVYPPNQSYVKKLSYEKEIFSDLIKKLPANSKFKQNFHYSFTNWLPFYWAGFKQTTRYTYIIKPENKGNVFSNIKDNIRRQIRKAEKIVTLSQSNDINKFYELNLMTFSSKNNSIPYDLKFLRKIDNILSEKKSRIIIFAKDNLGNLHSAGYFIEDNNSIYYLMGGNDQKFKKSGAASLIIWQGIQFALDRQKNFNFEGSMHESIERFFRSFGAIQTPYMSITKVNNKLIKLLHLQKD